MIQLTPVIAPPKMRRGPGFYDGRITAEYMELIEKMAADPNSWFDLGAISNGKLTHLRKVLTDGRCEVTTRGLPKLGTVKMFRVYARYTGKLPTRKGNRASR